MRSASAGLRVFGLSGLSRPAKIAANVIVVAGFAVTCVAIVHDWFLMDDPSSTSGLLIPFMVAYVTAAVGFVAMLDWASRGYSAISALSPLRLTDGGSRRPHRVSASSHS
jgi:hypothetical protein